MRYAALLLALALVLAGCAAPPPAPPQPRAQDFTQPLALRVLDSRDRPLAGAKVELSPRQGSPLGRAVLVCDRQGEVRFSWRPKVVDHTAGSQVRDKVFDLVSELDYVVRKPGFFPARGRLRAVARGRRLVDPQLKRLGREPLLLAKTEVVVLRRLEEVFGGGLAGRPLEGPVMRRLLAFHRSMAPVLPHLGVEFAWPAFVQEGGRLRLRFAWRGAAWAGLSRAPLLGQVTASALLPLARAVGEELVPLGGVRRLVLEVVSETTPAHDPYALPTLTRVSLAAPVPAYRDLAAGRLSPDAFLARHPPRLVRVPPPRSADSESQGERR